MKRIIMTLATAAMLLGATAQDEKTVTLIYTNDTHSTVAPLSRQLSDTLKAGRGGFVRRVAMVEKERRENPDIIVVDCGDFSQGSPYYSIFKGEVEVKLMNRMGYDAVALGNHEFDHGMDNLARIARMATFSMVCCNYDFKGTVLEGLIKPWVIVEKGGAKVGITAVSPDPEGLISKDNFKGIGYLDPIAEAEKTARMLKEEKGCDAVICLSHLGWDMKPAADDSTLIANSTEIDMVVGGHTHSYFTELKYVKNKTGREIPADQQGKHGIYVGKTTLAIRNR